MNTLKKTRARGGYYRRNWGRSAELFKSRARHAHTFFPSFLALTEISSRFSFFTLFSDRHTKSQKCHLMHTALDIFIKLTLALEKSINCLQITISCSAFHSHLNIFFEKCLFTLLKKNTCVQWEMLFTTEAGFSLSFSLAMVSQYRKLDVLR